MQNTVRFPSGEQIFTFAFSGQILDNLNSALTIPRGLDIRTCYNEYSLDSKFLAKSFRQHLK